MKTAILSVLILILLSWNCLANSNMSEFDWIGKGYEAASKKNFPDAIKGYGKAIESNPDSVLAYYYRGLAYIESKMYQDAINDLSKVISNNGLTAHTCVKVVELFSEEGDENYEDVCTKGENKFYRVYHSLKEAEDKLNKLSRTPYFISHPKAIKSGERLLNRLKSDLMSLAARPNIAEAYFYRGVAFGRLERNDEQFSDFQKAKLLGFDIDKVKPVEVTREPPEKRPSGNKRTKISNEDIDYINSLNPLERAIFVNVITLERLKHYFKIVDRNAKQAVFLNGWIKRTASVHYRSSGANPLK